MKPDQLESLRELALDDAAFERLQQILWENETACQRTEEQISVQASLWQALIQSSSDLITILEPNGSVRSASPSTEKIVGYKPEELIGKNALEFIHPEDVSKVLNSFNCLIKNSDDVLSLNFRFRRSDGSWCFLESTGRNLLDNTWMAGIFFYSRDLTKCKQALEALRQQTEQAHLLGVMCDSALAAAKGGSHPSVA